MPGQHRARRSPSRRGRLLRTALVLVVVLVAAGGVVWALRPGGGRPAATVALHDRRPAGRPVPPPPLSTTVPAPSTTTTTVQPGWAVSSVTQGGLAVDTRTFTMDDGNAVTVYRFHEGLVRYALHVGGEDPPTAGVALPAAAGDSVSGDELPRLLDAFNGGFKAAAGAGGVEVDGQVLEPLLTGRASLVIDADGRARVGVWGQTVPLPGEPVLSVRQNLFPLVQGGEAVPGASGIGPWGDTLGGVSAPARSSLGEDAAGDLIYAASMSALPSDLASAQVQAGALSAMELDINPYWVQLAWAPAPGGPLATGVPGQEHGADTYLDGWTRDFVTVLAAPPPAPQQRLR